MTDNGAVYRISEECQYPRSQWAHHARCGGYAGLGYFCGCDCHEHDLDEGDDE